jgi:hypothetical protein
MPTPSISSISYINGHTSCFILKFRTVVIFMMKETYVASFGCKFNSLNCNLKFQKS